MDVTRAPWRAAWAVGAVATTVVLGLPAGCSSSDDGPGGSSGGVTGDGGVALVDGAVPRSDAGPGTLGGEDAGVPVVGSLLPNGGFETPGEMCGPGWTASYGSGIKVSLAHGGGVACRVCNGADAAGSFAMIAKIPAPKAGTWKIHAFLRVEPEAGYPLPTRGSLAATAVPASGPAGATGHTDPSLTATWSAVDLAFDVPAETASLDVAAGGIGDPGSCVEIDDVSVEAP